LDHLDRTMVVAMVTVRMVKATVNDVAGVIAVGNCLVATAGSMNMVRLVRSTLRNRTVPARIPFRDGDPVFFHGPVRTLVVKVAVVGIIDMAVVPECQVSTPRTVPVGMIAVVFTCHDGGLAI
jgi:hypothetical protein